MAGQGAICATALGLISVWQFVGIPMMLIYAALLSIPDEVIEAAECDGITGMAQFWKIQLPLILPSIGIISILTFVGNFNAFDLIYSAQGARRRAELLDRHPRHLPLPHLLRLPAAARRPQHGRGDRLDDVLHHPGRRAASTCSPCRRGCGGISSEEQADEPDPLLPRPHAARACGPDHLHGDRAVAGDPGPVQLVQVPRRHLRLAAQPADAPRPST